MTQFLRVVEVVAMLRVHPSTLKRYEARGLVKPLRDHNGVRHYTLDQVRELQEMLAPRQSPENSTTEPKD